MDAPHAKALHRAAELVGGSEELSKRLGVRPHALSLWMAGEAVTPPTIYRKAVEVISSASQELPHRDTTLAPGTGMRVLIVDDERDTVMTLGILLRSEGFDVRLTQAGNLVSNVVREFQPHAVLLDIGLPDRNGYEVARELAIRYGRSCPYLIAVTAHSSEADRQTARESGFHQHVAKPYDLDHILGLLVALNIKRPPFAARPA